jgi:hypothetical protein
MSKHTKSFCNGKVTKSREQNKRIISFFLPRRSIFLLKEQKVTKKERITKENPVLFFQLSLGFPSVILRISCRNRGNFLKKIRRKVEVAEIAATSKPT